MHWSSLSLSCITKHKFLEFLGAIIFTHLNFVLLCFVFLCVPIGLGGHCSSLRMETTGHTTQHRPASPRGQTTIQLNFKQSILNWACSLEFNYMAFRIQLSKWIRSATDKGNCNWQCVWAVWMLDIRQIETGRVQVQKK